MNNLLSCLLICFFCFFGTRLSVVQSSFTEIAPGHSKGDVVTQFDVKIKSTGAKTITIEQIWLNNNKASWTLSDKNQKQVNVANGKGYYSIQGEIKVKSEAGKQNSKPKPQEEKGTFKEAFVIAYKVGDSNSIKYLKIKEIENLNVLKKQ